MGAMARLGCAFHTSGLNYNTIIFNFTDQVSIVTLLFHISVLLRDFLFGRCFLSRTSPDLLGPCYRYTKQLISATPIRLLYIQSLNWAVQCGILNMALYSLLNILLIRQFRVMPRTICLMSQCFLNRRVSFRVQSFK